MVENPVRNMNAVRSLRTLRGWSQREFADLAGLSPHRLWRLENHRAIPTLDEIQKMWTALSSEN